MERSLNKKLGEKGLFEKHSFRDIKHRSKTMEDLYYRLNVLQNEGMIEVNRGEKGNLYHEIWVRLSASIF